MNNKRIFGFLKSSLDAHTMGICSLADMLEEIGYKVVICTPEVAKAFDAMNIETNANKVVEWICKNNINYVGVSYRLDSDDATEIFGRLYRILCRDRIFGSHDSIVKKMFFAGLPDACRKIKNEYYDIIATFEGGESVEETLRKIGISYYEIPKHIITGCKYDKELLDFGRNIINSGEYNTELPLVRRNYLNYGTKKDSLVERLRNNFIGEFRPLIRAHSGPYSKNFTREECLKKFLNWCQELSSAGFLDILSIGTSQLSQSNFGEDWSGLRNGGGVPVNSVVEFREIWEASKPMLVRTYSGSHNIRKMASIYEDSINMAWHALSLWWFNELDGRGSNSLYTNLIEHIETIRYIASIDKPFEANVSHHFAFRGCDDVTYIVSAYLAAKLAKTCGVRTYILQNMLNTPRSTWGVNDLAKSRALLTLVKSLEENDFRVILQTRTGLDFFKPDLDEAKIQLAATTALMDDIDPYNIYTPEIIHVVSYSEALFLSTPQILNESIKITRNALDRYRILKKKGLTPDVSNTELNQKTTTLIESAKMIITAMESSIKDLYSADGLYMAFVAGWLPVPELWNNSEEYSHAKNWKSKRVHGGVELVDKGLIIPISSRIDKCKTNQIDAEYFLKNRKCSKNLIYNISD